MGNAPDAASHPTVRVPVVFESASLGYVVGSAETANATALLLAYFAERESEGRALAAEVLHLYREVHLIEQLSEQLVALLDSSAVAESALTQAQRLIHATHGSVLVTGEQGDALNNAASFGDCSGVADPLGPNSRFSVTILERGIGEIVNDCAADPRAKDSECSLHALICVPLRAGQRTVGTIALGRLATIVVEMHSTSAEVSSTVAITDKCGRLDPRNRTVQPFASMMSATRLAPI
jgi:hypothetical protein